MCRHLGESSSNSEQISTTVGNIAKISISHDIGLYQVLGEFTKHQCADSKGSKPKHMHHY